MSNGPDEATPLKPTSALAWAELRNNPVVSEAIEQAWQNSKSEDPLRRHEEGGWIYLNIRTAEISVRRALAGGQTHIDLSNPPIPQRLCGRGEIPHAPEPDRGRMGTRTERCGSLCGRNARRARFDSGRQWDLRFRTNQQARGPRWGKWFPFMTVAVAVEAVNHHI